MTPYRTARIDGRVADPSRPKFGLVGAAIGSLACFLSLVDLYFGRFTSIDAVLLFGGSAAMVLMLAYSALDAPAGRGTLFVALTVFAFSFVPQLLIPSWMGDWVWSVRYLGVAGIACGLLLRLRRTRPGRYGGLLRLAGVISAWWSAQWAVAMMSHRGHQSARAEAFSRVVYLLLAAGMLDLRRWVGAVPVRDAARGPVDAAREIATTRVCLGVVSVGAALTTLPYEWHSEWAVIASAELVAIGITLAIHIPWIMRQRPGSPPFAAAGACVVGGTLAWLAFGIPWLAAVAATAFAIGNLVVDVAVASLAANAKPNAAARPAYLLACGAVAVHFVGLVIVALRVLKVA